MNRTIFCAFLPRRLCSLRGIVISTYVCMCMGMYVNSWRFFLGAPVAFYVGTGNPMGNISRPFFEFLKFSFLADLSRKKGKK